MSVLPTPPWAHGSQDWEQGRSWNGECGRKGCCRLWPWDSKEQEQGVWGKGIGVGGRVAVTTALAWIRAGVEVRCQGRGRVVVLSPEVEGKKVLGEISKGVVEPHFGVVSGVRRQVSPAQPAAGHSLPWYPGPPALADWAEWDRQRREGGRKGGSCRLRRAGWGEPVSQSPGIRSPRVISFFPPSLFPTRKGLILLTHVAHPSEKACLRLARGLSGDALAPGAGTTPVLASSHHLPTPSHAFAPRT